MSESREQIVERLLRVMCPMPANAAEDTAHRPFIEALYDQVVAPLLAEAKRQALTEAADRWQWGDWANAPRRADRIQERIANGQFVTDWLRARAEEASPYCVAPGPEE